jgi:hypothetical protein
MRNTPSAPRRRTSDDGATGYTRAGWWYTRRGAWRRRWPTFPDLVELRWRSHTADGALVTGWYLYSPRCPDGVHTSSRIADAVIVANEWLHTYGR